MDQGSELPDVFDTDTVTSVKMMWGLWKDSFQNSHSSESHKTSYIVSMTPDACFRSKWDQRLKMFPKPVIWCRISSPTITALNEEREVGIALIFPSTTDIFTRGCCQRKITMSQLIKKKKEHNFVSYDILIYRENWAKKEIICSGQLMDWEFQIEQNWE